MVVQRYMRNAVLLAALVSMSVWARPANEDTGLGLNLTRLAYWSTQWVLIDVMKQASVSGGRIWAPSNQTTFDTGENSLLDLDAQGWPRSLPEANSSAAYRFLTTIVFHDNRYHPGGRFVVLYDGEGSLRYTGGALVAAESRPGRHVIEVAADASLFLHVDATDPNRSGNYLRNIRVLVPGGICNSDPMAFAENAAACSGVFSPFEQIHSQQRIHPLFLKDMERFRSLRFMEMFLTNASPVRNWSQRTRVEQASWAIPSGAPLDLAVEMANRLHAEPWLNLPAQVDDDYIRNFARQVRQQLASHLLVYFELGNEVWNSAYPYNIDANWFTQRGREWWPDSNASDFELRLNAYGRRVHEMCTLVKAEFGSDAGRVRCVSGAQSGNSWVANQVLACPLWAAQQNGAGCASKVDAIAIAPYFAGYVAQDRYLPYLSQWLAQPGSAPLDNLFSELSSGLLYQQAYDPSQPEWSQPPRDGALAKAAEEMRANQSVATQFGKLMVAYEGGQHLTYAGNLAGDRAAVNDRLFLAGNRDTRMGAAFTRHFDDWRAAGGGPYLVFESIGRWGPYGAFPLKEYQRQPESEAPKWAAVQDYLFAVPCWWVGCQRTINEPPPPPPPPPQLVATAEPVAATRGIALNWNSIPQADRFRVYRDDRHVATLAAGSQRYQDDGLELGRWYQYRVEWIGADGAVGGESSPAPLMAGELESSLLDSDQYLWMVPSAVNTQQQGFLRLINRGNIAGDVSVWGLDAAGNRSRGTITLTLSALETRQFNSQDLEQGNPSKGLTGSLGSGSGDWTIIVRTALDVETLAYIRTPDGFLTSMHDRVDGDGTDWTVPLFNPAENVNQVSRLRLINTSAEVVSIQITGIDDAGAVGAAAVTLTLSGLTSIDLSAPDLESGNASKGLIGGLGNGRGKWQLQVSASGRLTVQSLLYDPLGKLTNLSTLPDLTQPILNQRVLWLVPSASNTAQQGFVRLINRENRSGTVSLRGVDDAGQLSPGIASFRLAANASAQFNSQDLEFGNTSKGLSGSLGDGSGNWRLLVTTDLDLWPMALIRTPDGFLTTVHDIVAGDGLSSSVVIFNPADNRSQVSSLRLVNPNLTASTVTLRGIDDAGQAGPGGNVTLTLAGGAATELTSTDLEFGNARKGLNGSLGNGSGKWRLSVHSTVPVKVMGLLNDPNGYLTNLSSGSKHSDDQL